MSNDSIAISVDSISKCYQIGKFYQKATFRENLMKILKAPFKRTENEKIWALKDVTFNVKEGEVLGLIGRNGAGKSTLLKVLSKITYPTSGVINVEGRISSLLEVGTGFHDELTGRENIFLNGSILGMSKKEITSRLDDIISFSGIKRFVDTPVKKYSSGMRLRLGFAVAAHLQAEVLLVDEILAVGDAEFQKKCLDRMNDIGGSGRTVVFVSHNMAAVENLCPRAIWVDDGMVRMDGPTDKVIRDYLASFSLTQEAGADFKHITERIGTGEVIFTGLEYLSTDKKRSELCRPGDALIVRLHFHAEKRIEKPNFGIELYSETGTFITSLNTWSTGLQAPFIERGDGSIDVEIGELNLMPGRYLISLWLDGAKVHYDRLDYCTALSVEDSDYYGTGRGMNSRKFGFLIIPTNWTLNGTPLIKQNHLDTKPDQRE